MENNIHYHSYQKFSLCTERHDSQTVQEIAPLDHARVQYQSGQNKLWKILLRFSQSVFSIAETSVPEPLYLPNMKSRHNHAEKRKLMRWQQIDPNFFPENLAEILKPKTKRRASLYQKIFGTARNQMCFVGFLSEQQHS